MPFQDKLDNLPDYPSTPSDTSEAAAEAVQPEKAEALRDRIFDLIQSRGELGCTDDEMQDWLKLEGNTQRPRRWELSHKQGRISASGATRKTRTGRLATVWTVNQYPTLMNEKTKQPKQVTVTHKRSGEKIRQFTSFVTGKGNVQVVTFPQSLTVLSGDTVEIK